MRLEDEAFLVKELQGWCRVEKIPQRGRGIRPRIVAADISSAPQSGEGVEEVEDEDQRSAGPGE
jgi:hypothetical protein